MVRIKRLRDDGMAAARLRQALVDRLTAERLITQRAVEAAFRAVPRHLFLPEVTPEQAYGDVAIATKRIRGVAVSSSSQPAIMAVMLEQLDLRPGHRVLEIGAGTGYNAALMAYIVGETGRVVSVDIDEDVTEGAHRHLGTAGINDVHVVLADGSEGYAEEAPYDRIILTVGAADILPAWRDQLTPDGRLVLPLALGGPQETVALDRVGDRLESRSMYDCGFMRLRGSHAEADLAVRLGPEPGISLTPGMRTAIDPGRVYDWLTGPHTDTLTRLMVRPQELSSGLRVWLGLHDARTCTLTAEGDLAERGIVPRLIQGTGPELYTTTFGLLGDRRIDLLTYEGSRPDTFALCVRSFGDVADLAGELGQWLGVWDGAGRPMTSRLHLAAYRKGEAPQPNEGQVRVRKEASDLLLWWR
ncbi:MAG: methyltransferase, FxLD system [Chloroflexota bacterium]